MYGAVFLVGRTQEVKVGVDPLAIILSGPPGKLVLSIPATLGSMRSEVLTLRRGTRLLRDTKCFTKARVTGDSQGTSWCFCVCRWAVTATVAWVGHQGWDLSWVKVNDGIINI